MKLLPSIWLFAIGVGALLIATWLRSTGDVRAYLTHALPPGQLAYVVSKLLGMLAAGLLWLQLLVALLRFVPGVGSAARVSLRAHAGLGLATAGMAGAHVACFLVASALRTGHSPWALLLPRFDMGFYRERLSFGAIALWLLLFTLVAGALRMRVPAARWLHRLGLLAFVPMLVHALGVGSETRMDGIVRVFWLFAVSVAVLAASWLVRASVPALRRARR